MQENQSEHDFLLYDPPVECASDVVRVLLLHVVDYLHVSEPVVEEEIAVLVRRGERRHQAQNGVMCPAKAGVDSAAELMFAPVVHVEEELPSRNGAGLGA